MISRAALYRISPAVYQLADRLYRASPLAKRRQQQNEYAQRQRMQRNGERVRQIVSKYLPGEYRVRHGLFAGMLMTLDGEGSVSLPRLIGSYEQPIQQPLAATTQNCDTIINVGSSEGYFAVGLALKTNANVYAFDIQPSCQRACQELASLNGVSDRVLVDGMCGWDQIARLATPKTLLLCDIEGGETNLLNPAACPALSKIDIIVETHETMAPGCIRLLSERFWQSHKIVEYHDYPRSAADYSCLSAMPREIAAECIDEYRNNGQTWLCMTALRR